MRADFEYFNRGTQDALKNVYPQLYTRQFIQIFENVCKFSKQEIYNKVAILLESVSVKGEDGENAVLFDLI